MHRTVTIGNVMNRKFLKCLTLLLIATNTQTLRADMPGTIARLTGTFIGAGGALTGTGLCFAGAIGAAGSTLLKHFLKETKNSIGIEDHIRNCTNPDFYDFKRALNNAISISESL